jgi:hypothetical protein
VPFLRCFRRNIPQQSKFTSQNFTAVKSCPQLSIVAISLLIGGASLAALPCAAQISAEQAQTGSSSSLDSQTNPPQASPSQSNSAQTQNQPQTQNSDQNQNPTQAEIKLAPVTLPTGTLISLVLTHSIQSRYIHRGDDIYAQVTFPVNSGNEVVIPAGTFVQGVVDKLDESHGRAELRLQGMSITFPDGYVAPIAGPVTLVTAEGYALKDPGPHRGGVAMALIGGGAGIGALIGHSAGSSSSVQTTTLPAGCTGPPPYCQSSSMTIPGRKGFDTGMGLVIGGAAGGVAAFSLLASSRHFFVDVGTPVDLTLRQPITLQGDEVAAAVRQTGQQGTFVQPVFPRPAPPPLPDAGPTFPTNPGTPPTIIPGAPGPGGVPGPPIIIPGTPPGA